MEITYVYQKKITCVPGQGVLIAQRYHLRALDE
jgi:hypothetical protein